MNIGIIGLGFMGGCIARSLRKSPKIKRIIAMDSNKESLELAKKDGVIEIAQDLQDFAECDIIFLCCPVGYIKEYAKKLENIIKEDCILTDIGSTKTKIYEETKDLNINFIYGHPMVGSERKGYATSNDHLFENAYYILINSNERIIEVIKELKAIPILISIEEHDHVVAAISHVPQIIATTLVNTVKDFDNEHMKTLAAGGFKDITRIASSDPTMWEHICHDNEDEIRDILGLFINKLQDFKDNILGNDKGVYKYIETGRDYRNSFNNIKINGEAIPKLEISIKDEFGSVEKVIHELAINKINIKNLNIVNNRENMNGVLSISFEKYEDLDRAKEALKIQ